MILEKVIEMSAKDAEIDRDSQADNLRCLVCDTPVTDAVCGRKQPCPGCGYPYPLGDCSDLAEN